MRTTTPPTLWRRVALLAAGLLFLTGCDPTIQATVENGVITASQSLLASFFQAILQVATTQPAT